MAEALTNEALKGICNSNFELAHFAIALARYYIHSGRETHLREIIRDIKKHPNPKYIEELKEIDEIERRAQEHNASAARYE
jgi:C-terminal processing protease CtpA/Prc